MSRQARRHGRRVAPGVRFEPRHARQRRPRRRLPGRYWLVAGAGFLVLLVAINLWLHSQPPAPDNSALHADILATRTGAEETFTATVLAAPSRDAEHEHIEVGDGLGDQLELDYNLTLGAWVPVAPRDQIEVHGQLYVDQGRAGVHCLHAQTSSGCPVPGWIRFQGQTYS